MRAATYSAIRANLARALDQVNEDQAPILITRQRGKSAVLVSLEEFNSWQETAHLARSPKNAARLLQALRDLAEGRGIAFNPRAKSSGRRRRSRTIAAGSKKNRASPRGSTR